VFASPPSSAATVEDEFEGEKLTAGLVKQ
jgi:hypothetical protein